jgi:hypothetical protein
MWDDQVLQYINYELKEIECNYSSLVMIDWQDKDHISGKSHISQNLANCGDMGTKRFQLKFGGDLVIYDRLVLKIPKAIRQKLEDFSY